MADKNMNVWKNDYFNSYFECVYYFRFPLLRLKNKRGKDTLKQPGHWNNTLK